MRETSERGKTNGVLCSMHLLENKAAICQAQYCYATILATFFVLPSRIDVTWEIFRL